jgi:hypothetical protein
VRLLRILIVIPLAYVAACFAAGLMLVAPIMIGGGAPVAMNVGFSIVTALFIAISVGPLAAVPTLVAVILAEWFAWRSFFFWTLLGGAIGFTALNFGPDIEGAWSSAIGPLYVSAGFAGGAVYWLVAGRRSGVRDNPHNTPDP